MGLLYLYFLQWFGKTVYYENRLNHLNTLKGENVELCLCVTAKYGNL
jgi:hypothetical protein